MEDLLIEFIDRAITELPVESLPDEQVLALCDMQMETEQQEHKSDLLARNTEGQPNQVETQQLQELMQVYRRGERSQSKSLKSSGRTWLEIILRGCLKSIKLD